MLTMQQQEALVSQGLAKKKINEELGLVTYKYAKKVMYDYLWDKHPELLMCRGHVYDVNTGKLVIAAPKKSFNYLENGTWKDKPLHDEWSNPADATRYMIMGRYAGSSGEVKTTVKKRYSSGLAL